MKNYFDLTGQVAVVTGCSTGLGVQMAKALANQGAKIVAIARRKELIDAVADTYKVEAVGIQCDITDTDRVNAVIDEIMAKFGRIDILINNAGTGAVAPAEDITDDQFYNEINIDMFGSFRMARAIAKKAMIPAKYGRIINIASMYGMVGNKVAPCSPYHAAKGGVVNMTRGLASEWGKYNINVNAICPGFFASEANSPEAMEAMSGFITARTPMGRPGNPGELDSTVVYLAAHESSYVTGAICTCDGGWTCV